MRLLQYDSQNTIRLTRDFPDHSRPRYAILSHCWAEDNSEEVTFAEVETDVGRQKPGYKKIQFCAEQARRDGVEYFWVDTCCINKENHVELSEAITSMFRWYREAIKCYVYLADVSHLISTAQPDSDNNWHADFRKSRWFTRGWTLQELLAPEIVEFFSIEESLLGTKQTLAVLINDITTLPLAALANTPLSQFPINEKLRWTEHRQTTKEEDKAYCLLGIFEVYMPLIYGERDNAVRRLEEEISKRHGHSVAGILSGHPETRSLGLCLNTAPLIESSEFVGRAAEIESIHAILQSDAICKEQKKVVVGGIGGMGKTQLAIAYAREHKQSYTSVLWLNATSEMTLRASFRTVVQSLVTAQQLAVLDDDQAVAYAREWLSNQDNTQWLLILDNYDEPDQFKIENYMPNVGHGSIILTTRLPELVTGSKIRVEPLQDINDGIAILAVRSQRDDVHGGKVVMITSRAT